MKKIFSLLLAATLLLGTVASLASCGAPKDAGAEIVVDLGGDVFDFDPTDYYADSNAEQIMSLLFEPLFKISSKGKLQCAGAKDYSVDEKNREIAITLRESYWSDEMRVKAEDYIYAWREVLLAPSNPNPASALLYDIENAVAVKAGELSTSDLGAVATGAYELKINYREGCDYKQLLENLASIATSPIRYEASNAANTYWSKDISTIISNGPFKIQALDHSVGEFKLVRNLGYHQSPSAEDYTDKVRPAALISFVTADAEYQLSYDDIENKTVFFMGDASLEDRKANSNKAKVVDALSTYTYVFNTEKDIFKNKDVRRALSLAIDRTKIVEDITFGKAATGLLPDPVSKSVYGKTPETLISADYSANLAEAKNLIAGVSLTSAQKSFTLTVNYDEESLAIANIAKDCWAELGFNVTIDAVSSTETTLFEGTADETTFLDSEIQVAVKEASYGNRDFDVIAVDWQMYSADALVSLASFTSHMNGNGFDFNTGAARKNISGWASTDFDQYINLAFKAESDSDRAAALKNAEKLLIDESPIAPIIFNQNFAFISSELTSVSVDGLGHFVLTGANQKNYHKYLEKEEK